MTIHMPSEAFYSMQRRTKWRVFCLHSFRKWVVLAPASLNVMPPAKAFDSWSAAMAFILATDTRKAA